MPSDFFPVPLLLRLINGHWNCYRLERMAISLKKKKYCILLTPNQANVCFIWNLKEKRPETVSILGLWGRK